MTTATWVGLCMLGVSAGEDSLNLRPWAQVSSPRAIAEQRLQPGELRPEEAAEAVRSCFEVGGFEVACNALVPLLEAYDAPEAVWRCFGAEPVDGQWRLSWGLRAQRTAQPAPSLPELDEREAKRQLARFEKDLGKENRSSYFELFTDLSASDANFYARVLDRHFRRLKSRFRAYNGREIDVLLYAKRSDYLRFYQQNVGAGGEHVSGFYYADHLVFYDDPLDRSGVANTATHECTHLLIDRCFHQAPIPPWLHEGMACYFAGECDEGLGRYTCGLFMTVLDRIQSGRPLEVDALLSVPADDFEYLHYALAWSFLHFLDSGQTQARFQGFLESLRDRLIEEPGREFSANEVASLSAKLFHEVFPGMSRELGEQWTHHVRDEYSIRSPQQAIDFAEHCLYERAPSIQDADRRRQCVDMAIAALSALPQDLDPASSSARDLARCAGTLERAVWTASSGSALRLGFEQLVRELDNLPSDVEPYGRGRLSANALRRLAGVLFPTHPAVFDLRAALTQKLDTVVAGSAPEEEWLALLALHDDLRRRTRESFLAALQADPLHAPTLHRWLFLAMETCPEMLDGLFARLRLLAEADPDDRNLAALAVAYRGMGNVQYARSLLEEARARSISANELASFARYLE